MHNFLISFLSWFLADVDDLIGYVMDIQEIVFIALANEITIDNDNVNIDTETV